MNNIVIIGAGMAGLIAAHRFPQAQVIEASSYDQLVANSHKALLRFRSDAISELTGIPFRKVKVHKAIVTARYGMVDKCNIHYANTYSKKVTGLVADRSIWNLSDTERWIAPEDFHRQMIDKLVLEDRIKFNVKLGEIDPDTSYINTAPLAVVMRLCGMEPPKLLQNATPINVRRVNLGPDVDVFQTIYYPEKSLSTYRASITGNVLIVESTLDDSIKMRAESVADDFGVDLPADFNVEEFTQRMGKIVDLPAEQRRAILYHLTREHNIYSIGRFAAHRNILLDDVVQDLESVAQLINSSEYSRNIMLCKHS